MGKEGTPPVVRLVEVDKDYVRGEERVRALRGVSLEVRPGEFLAVEGPSGCGKSTLLHLMGALDIPTRGEVWLDGRPLRGLGDRELSRIRRSRVGFIYQFFNLLSTLSAWENVALPLVLNGLGREEVQGRTESALRRVGLLPRARHFPHELSGGEMQRVAIARAVVHGPAMVLADEPTGDLDARLGREVLELLADLNREGHTIVLATHSPEAASFALRRLPLRDGVLGVEEVG
ncbi:MAG: ABC transporter ATP-binding protein [Nitrospinota bacterium]